MRLRELLGEVPADLVRNVRFETDPEIRDLAYDSRRTEEGALFFAVAGLRSDGHLFIDEALSRGAVAVASERPIEQLSGGCRIQVRSIRRFMADCADAFFGRPSRSLRLAGITGTNGKTTTAHLMHAILSRDDKALMLGTVQTRIGTDIHPSTLTTPEAVDIQSLLRRGVEAGCRYGVLEVSSHALLLQRARACRFPVALFTNLTQDHLDFHGSLEDYFAAKKLLFTPAYNSGLEHAVVNGDDPWGRRLLEMLPEAFSYGLDKGNRVRVVDYSSSVDGIRMRIRFFDRTLELESPLAGRHNVYNLLAAATASSLLGAPDGAIRDGVRATAVVPGRFEKVDIDRPFAVVIDYAHTPDALENVLRLAREVTQHRLICVFGCGGDRDRAKRPRMGEIAARLCDLALITSDNPRTEDPEKIVADIRAGVPGEARNVETIVDRRGAIRRALQLAAPGDLVLLAGKGHETYQSIGGRRIAFDERRIVMEELCSS
jgi:UDP-N-acetylmuramoyl-L-alanyl-D-glutamate--2,6-diaminopimelate ligase